MTTMGIYAVVMPDESIPPYQRIAGDLEARIRSGELASGDRVPSLTTLSQEYDVAKNTVIKAVKVLEARGLVKTRQGWGTFVA
jgi:DNA-binding GntR family transcriptional regulator